MGADLSRIRSNPLLDFAGVELKQGGVVLDADFNELVAIVDRRMRAAASDILGRATVSSTTPDAFKLTAVAGGLQIGQGRLYVDGLLAENHGVPSELAANKQFDDLLAETRFAERWTCANQPYLPHPPALPTAGRHLVYLDVWDRELTHLERPALVEPAVGVETSSRRQTVWQVRVLEADAGAATCGAPDEDLPGWQALIAPSTGRLSTGTFDVPPAADPCELPPTGGYRGLENQTYRVEIHDPGQPGGTASFKWSRENASVGARITSMVSATELELDSLGRDDVLRFNTDDWVEILDDRRELSQRSGEMRRITVNEAARRISFTPALPAEMLPGAFPDSDFPALGNLRVRRWDQQHQVLQTGAGGTTSLYQDLDAGSSGVIQVPAAGTTLILENGITVSFESTGAKGFKAGDFWVFAARTADASVELLTREPPRGIHHHFARLGLWDVTAGTVTDCRHPWPPAGDGHDCSCTQCVTAASHNSGQFTIQDAVDRVRDTGGTVCLGVGSYQLDQAVQLDKAMAVRIRGQGAATLVIAPGGAFAIQGGAALAIEDLAVLSLGRAPAISVRTVLGLTLQRLEMAVLGAGREGAAAIALSGVVVGAVIRDNTIIAPVAVQALEPAQAQALERVPPAFLLTAVLRIVDNLLWCERQAVVLAGPVLHLEGTHIERNELLGCRQGGVIALGLGSPGAAMVIARNHLAVGGPGIVAGVDGLWIEGNKLQAVAPNANTAPIGAGISLRAGLDPNGVDECQILANQVEGFSEAGILVGVPTGDLIIKLNTVQRCGNGIVCQDEAKARQVAIENNLINDIGRANSDAKAEILGVGLLRAEAASVCGNTIRRVGVVAKEAALRAGIAATAVLRLRVAQNDVADIAPVQSFDVGMGAGILVRPPFAQVQVTDNLVERESEPLFQGGGRFVGVQIADVFDPERAARTGAYSMLRLDAGRWLVLGAARPFVARMAMANPGVAGAAAETAPGGTSVLGNSVGSRGDLPAVWVVTSGDGLFSNNRCELRGGGRAAVDLSAGATIVHANRVRGGELSMLLQGNAKLATVLGNITTGGIHLGGGVLGAPWAALNVQG